MNTGWNQETKQTDHSSLMRYVKKMSRQELEFCQKDLYQVITLNPDNPKNGYYQDMLHYIEMERAKRHANKN